MEIQTIRINFKKQNTTFSERERFMNEEIIKQIDAFRLNGLFTKDHEVISKNASSFAVKFTLIRR